MISRALLLAACLSLLQADTYLPAHQGVPDPNALVAVEMRLQRMYAVSKMRDVGASLSAVLRNKANIETTGLRQHITDKQYPIWARRFNAIRNPFLMTAAQLLTSGGHVDSRSDVLAANWWRQGFPGEAIANGTPFFNAGNDIDPLYKLSCLAFSARGCSAHGVQLHIPDNYTTESGSDHHVVLYNKTSEYDMWGGDPNNKGEQCALQKKLSVVHCAWGGTFELSGKGLGYNGNEAQAGGAAFGLSYISLGDLYSGAIRHALAINQECVDNPNRYPSDTTTSSGQTCNTVGSLGTSPAPTYGQMIHLKMTTAQIADSGASYYCRIILNAFAMYGAYPEDVQNQAIMFKYEGASEFGSADDPTNPWYPIFSSLAAGGDGSGSGSTFRMSSCFNRINGPQNIEVIDDPNLGY